MITTQKELRDSFWAEHPNNTRIAGKTQNYYPTDVRIAWCDFVEAMARDKQITKSLAERATL